jgi:hypothetical protein
MSSSLCQTLFASAATRHLCSRSFAGAVDCRLGVTFRPGLESKYPQLLHAAEQTNRSKFLWLGDVSSPNAIFYDIAVPDLFAYDYPQMAANMAEMRRELLAVVMHPRNLSRLPSLGLN